MQAFHCCMIFAFCLSSQVKLSEKLSHVQSLCLHEMIVRAFKHILQAVISAVVDKQKIATSIACALNLLLGVPENRELDKSCEVHPLVWRWLELFLKKRFNWDLCSSNYKDLRKFAILRGLCHKVLLVVNRICRFCCVLHNILLCDGVTHLYLCFFTPPSPSLKIYSVKFYGSLWQAHIDCRFSLCQ